MKMKRYVAAAAALLIMVSMIGSGFSYWFFNNVTDEKDQGKINMNVTQLVEVGTVSAASAFGINFDQSTTGRTTYGSNPFTQLGNATGITLTWGDSPTKKAVYNATNDDNQNITDLENGVVYYTFTVTVTLSTKLDNYIDITTNQSGWTKNAGTKNESAGTTTYTFTAYNTEEFNWENVSITYKSGKEPDNQASYLTFLEAVYGAKAKDAGENAATISVKYNVTLSGGNAPTSST